MIKNYIWDFDGMLFNSYPHIATAFLKMLKENNIEANSENVMRCLKKSFREAYREYNINDELKMVFRKYEDEIDMEPIIEPYPDTYDVLKKIYDGGGKNYLFTHRNERAIDYIKKYDMGDFFVEYVTSESGFKSKPDPDAILYLVNKYNMTKAETIMIGDREIDIMSGKNAGVKACLFDEFGEKPKTEADIVITNIRELTTY